jgi:putative transposase
MSYNPNTHHRRSIRLKDYDYALPGAYFVTILTDQRQCMFGEIVNGVMQCNKLGQIADWEWARLKTRFSFIKEEAFIVMPNHVHGIVVIDPDRNIPNPTRSSHFSKITAHSLGTIIRSYKATVAYRIKCIEKTVDKVWHRNYYERVIRNEKELERIRQYIASNPISWEIDQGDNTGFY